MAFWTSSSKPKTRTKTKIYEKPAGLGEVGPKGPYLTLAVPNIVATHTDAHRAYHPTPRGNQKCFKHANHLNTKLKQHETLGTSVWDFIVALKHSACALQTVKPPFEHKQQSAAGGIRRASSQWYVVSRCCWPDVHHAYSSFQVVALKPQIA